MSATTLVWLNNRWTTSAEPPHYMMSGRLLPDRELKTFGCGAVDHLWWFWDKASTVRGAALCGWGQTEDATAADNAGSGPIWVMCDRMKADTLRVKLKVVISGFVLLPFRWHLCGAEPHASQQSLVKQRLHFLWRLDGLDFEKKGMAMFYQLWCSLISSLKWVQNVVTDSRCHLHVIFEQQVRCKTRCTVRKSACKAVLHQCFSY